MNIAKPHMVSDKQWTAIGLVERYRVLTPDLLAQFSPQDSRDGLRMLFDRLCKQYWLCKTTLVSSEPCYALGPKAQRLFALHQHRGFPFGADGLLQHLGIALFCALARFQRLLPHEFHERFPDCHRAGLPAQNYCLDTVDDSQVCFAIVDHATEPRRFTAKVAKVVSDRLCLPGFTRLIQREQFAIVIITATTEKKARIETLVQDRLSSTVPISVVAVPPLLQFLLQPRNL